MIHNISVMNQIGPGVDGLGVEANRNSYHGNSWIELRDRQLVGSAHAVQAHLEHTWTTLRARTPL